MTTEATLYGSQANRRLTVRDLQSAKDRGEKWAMLTSYDALTAGIFEQAGIPVLLVGDSVANNVLGYDNTVPVTVQEMLPFVQAVVRGSKRALVIADLPFGSYQASAAQALETSCVFMKQGGAHAIKLEGGRRVVAQVTELVAAGVPVMGHIGLTPQSVNVLGGYRVQGRNAQAEELIADAVALTEAGAFAIVLELVPAELAERITKEISIPTVGIGAGPACDAQVLVWQDMAGMHEGPGPKFLRKFADVRTVLSDAARDYSDAVRTGAYPAEDHTYV